MFEEGFHEEPGLDGDWATPVEPSPELMESDLVDNTAALAENAAGGGFAVDPTTAGRLLAAVRTLRDYLTDGTLAGLEVLGERPKMSQTDTAMWTGEEMLRTASDADGFLTRLHELRNTLPNVESAFESAMRNYQEMETRGEQSLRCGVPGLRW